MPILADGFILPSWAAFLIAGGLLALLILENAFLRRLRLEVVIKEKRSIQQNYGGFTGGMDVTGDLAYGGFNTPMTRNFVVVEVSGREVMVPADSAAFSLAKIGSQVVLVCSLGRFTRRIIPISIEFPMPESPVDAGAFM